MGPVGVGRADHFHVANHLYAPVGGTIRIEQVPGMDGNDTCIVCGRAGGYHRAVVDTFEAELVGGLCRECEREQFGHTLERGFFESREGCVLCDRDGHVAIPLWRPVARETSDGTVVSEVTYAVDDGTVRLCDEHLSAFAGAFPTRDAHPVPQRHR